MTRTLVVGDRIPVERMVEALVDAGTNAESWTAPTGGDDEPGSSAALARRLVELEGALEAARPGAVALADDSDTTLAAALVATKLLIPVNAAPGATEAQSVNGRLISQLAAAYTESG